MNMHFDVILTEDTLSPQKIIAFEVTHAKTVTHSLLALGQ